MLVRLLKGSRSFRLVVGAGMFLGAALPLQAQQMIPGGRYCPPSGAAPIYPSLPTAPATPGTPSFGVPSVPSVGTPSGTPSTSAGTAGTPGATTSPPTDPLSSVLSPGGISGGGFEGEGTSVALGGSSFSPTGGGAVGSGAATGYIDSAIPLSNFRMRFDSAYNNNRPDRAEYFYGKCGCFRMAGDPSAPGPGLVESRVDYQDITGYLEMAFDNRMSGFIEVPIRFLNPLQNDNTAGLGDMNVGFKYAFVACPDRYYTFQFRTYIPTGDADRGLGTDHVSLEPAFLVHQQLSERIALDAELRDWIPVGGTDFAGNVLRYGVGLSYLALENCNYRVIPVAELVGWTVLSGKQLAVPGDNVDPNLIAVLDASGDTILNAKLGVRVGFGQLQGDSMFSRSDLYVGYGRALTGEVWYKDVVRVEYRLAF